MSKYYSYFKSYFIRFIARNVSIIFAVLYILDCIRFVVFKSIMKFVQNIYLYTCRVYLDALFTFSIILNIILNLLGFNFLVNHSFNRDDSGAITNFYLTFCSGSDSSDSAKIDSSTVDSDDPISAASVDSSVDASLKIDVELARVPCDVEDLAVKSKALADNKDNKSSKDDSFDDSSIHIVDTSLINYISTMYDEARICVDRYDSLSVDFSKKSIVSANFEHFSSTFKTLFLNHVSISIEYSRKS